MYNHRQLAIYLLTILVACCIFLIDLFLPLGVAAGVPYVAVIMMGWWLHKPQYIFISAALCTVLIALGFALSVPGGVAWMVSVNRGLAAFAIWVTATLLYLAKIRESRVLESEEKLRLLTNSVPVAIAYVDASQRFRFNNATHCRWLNKKPEELRGRRFDEIVPENFYAEAQPYIERALKGEEVGYEFEAVFPDGRRRHLFAVYVPDLDPVGTVRGFSALIEDITERKSVEKMKSEFISIASHELRTPLTSVVGSLGLILGGATGELPPKTVEILNIAKNNVDRLARLINNVLDLERIESGALNYVWEQVDLTALVQEAIEANTSYADGFGVGLRMAETPPEAVVQASKDALMQVLTNLLSNAAKFSPSGSEVVVALSSGKAGVRVTVSDEGPGIPEEFHDTLFDRFTQVESQDSRTRGGSGLGLSIAKGIVEHHGGRIGFETELGKGTRFYFDLPWTPSTQTVSKGTNSRTRTE